MQGRGVAVSGGSGVWVRVGGAGVRVGVVVGVAVEVSVAVGVRVFVGVRVLLGVAVMEGGGGVALGVKVLPVTVKKVEERTPQLLASLRPCTNTRCRPFGSPLVLAVADTLA